MVKTLNYKVVLFGETSVGKSSIVSRFINDTFLEFREPTIGAAFQTQSTHIGDCIVKMEFWDTAGQERYRSFAPLYYRGAKAAFIVYDITDSDSLVNAKYWIDTLNNRGEPDCILVLLGNKSDLHNRQVEYEDVATFAKSNNILFSEVSAKNGSNIHEIMINVAKELASKTPSHHVDDEPFAIKRHTHVNTTYHCC